MTIYIVMAQDCCEANPVTVFDNEAIANQRAAELNLNKEHIPSSCGGTYPPYYYVAAAELVVSSAAGSATGGPAKPD